MKIKLMLMKPKWVEKQLPILVLFSVYDYFLVLITFSINQIKTYYYSAGILDVSSWPSEYQVLKVRIIESVEKYEIKAKFLKFCL